MSTKGENGFFFVSLYLFIYANGTFLCISPQALEEMALVEKDANGGRKLTSQGRRDMDRIAAQIAKL